MTEATLTIRPAHAADRPRCLEMLVALRDGPLPDGAAETFDALLDGTRGAIRVAERDGVVLGVATVSFNVAIRYGGTYGQLEELFVSPDARGLNAGARLVQATIDAARDAGCAEMGLYLVAGRTEHNRPFYEKLGFATIGDEMRQPLD